jgi:predicted nucleic acid-binding protein
MLSNYTGLLNEPIVLQLRIGELSDKYQWERAEKETLEKLDLLYEHFKIDKSSKDAQLRLLASVAQVHIRGFKILTTEKGKRSKGGRGKKWTQERQLELFLDVQEKVKIDSRTARNACSILISSKKRKHYANQNFESLYRRYMDFKKSFWIKSCIKGWCYQRAKDKGLAKKSFPEPPAIVLAGLGLGGEHKLTPVQAAIADEHLKKKGLG